MGVTSQCKKKKEGGGGEKNKGKKTTIEEIRCNFIVWDWAGSVYFPTKWEKVVLCLHAWLCAPITKGRMGPGRKKHVQIISTDSNV